MPPLNWDAFVSLPGAADCNFEMLCRALIRRHYGRYGHFAALAAQPGVEFHLRLLMSCVLGDPGRWYGWQCRWYDLPANRALGSARREKIREAIATSESELPELTDWVLWTRRPLTKGDQAWFDGLKTRMRLHQWTAAEVEEHLSGDAEILRGTYFGELILTPDALSALHTASVAPIRRRWQPETHQTIDAERALRRMLAESNTWDHVRKLADQLEADARAVKGDLSGLASPAADATAEVVKIARSVAAWVAEVHAALRRGDLDLLKERLSALPAPPSPQLAAIPRQLRAIGHRAGLTATNALASIHSARRLPSQIRCELDMRLVAVLADHGCGKTQVAAQLSAPTPDRPAGILLHGRDLHAGHSLDDLAHKVVIHGRQVPTMEALLAAVDAAGQRAKRRLPIVIDGLNEAEDPRDWKGSLASLNERLREYPYVLVVCMLRTAFANEALPADVEQLEIPDFADDAFEAIGRYFKYYRINAADAELPIGLLKHPLTLRLFCEVTNPKREHLVGVEAMPGSLTALFDRYLQQVAERIAELASRTHRYFEDDVRASLHEIGADLWEQRARSVGLSALRRRLNDHSRPWDKSIVRALEQDGVLLRDPGDTPADTRIGVVYDALAGHLVADALLAKRGPGGLETWLTDSATVVALAGPPGERHPLGNDIFRALVGLVPRRSYGRQVWPLVEEPLRALALRQAADLESAYLNAETVNELRTLVAQPPAGSRDLLDRLWDTRGSRVHPLNAEFLDSVLRPMAVADRDLRWTEWVRRHGDDLRADLQRLEAGWRETSERLPEDTLRARWIMWTLTSTVRHLRDQATRALYWFGRGDAAALFDLTLDALAVNDPYVPERLLAASYGVVIAHQLPDPTFAGALARYLTGLREALTGPTASAPTNHWLARLYVGGTVAFGRKFCPDAVPDGLDQDGRIPFAGAHMVEPIEKGDSRAAEVHRAIHMDFENYTVGRLTRDRANYDMNHPGHRAALAHVRGTIWALGWRQAGLGVVDDKLASHTPRMGGTRIERYGKKYGWIGFYTRAGELADKGLLSAHERLSDLGLDPSFPDPPAPCPIDLPAWARETPAEDRRWIRHGVVAVPDELLYRPALDPHPGPWIAVYGNLTTRDQTLGRRVFGVLTALLVASRDADRLVEALNPGNRWAPEEPGDYYVFAGEIPWSAQFAQNDAEDWDPLYRGRVDCAPGPPIEVEILAHRYSWEDYHSDLNRAGGALVPSRHFSAQFELRAIPQSFAQTLPDGSVVALSFAAPAGYDGHLLYLREDVVHRYARRRRLVWFLWGERQLNRYTRPMPECLVRAAREHADIWRHIRRGEELCRVFAPRNTRRRRPCSRPLDA